MIIQHNLPAMNSRRVYKKNNSSLSESLEKLSSGYRINRAGDDAAGLAVSEKMRSQIVGMKRAVFNSQDGISLIQTFEGALGETVSMIQRMKTLADQSANGSYDDEVDRQAIEMEFLHLCDEVNHIADTDFNGVQLINGEEPYREITVTETYYTTESVPYERLVYGTAYDADGNPSLNPESYRLNAEYSGIPISSSNHVIAPIYMVNGTQVRTEYGNGSTDFFRIKLTGTYNGASATYSFDNIRGTSSGSGYTISNPSITNTTNDAGIPVYTSTRTISMALTNADGTTDNISFNLSQTATQRIVYLTNSSGTRILDNSNNPIITALLWDMSFEISMAANSSTDFTLQSADMKYFSDTILNADRNERYYTSDTNDGFINHELMYDSGSGMLDSFSIYYFDSDDPTFNDISNRVTVDRGADGPSRLKLGLFGRRSSDTADSQIYEGNDLAYSLYWDNKAVAADGKITFVAGSRGLTNAKGDTNVTPQSEVGYRDIQVPHTREVVKRIPVDDYGPDDPNRLVVSTRVSKGEAKLTRTDNLVLQVGARTKDAVRFTFAYDSDGIGNLAADLDCTSRGLGLNPLTLATQDEANYAIDRLGHALNKVSMVRSTFGAVQNRLEHKIDNLNNSVENLTSAESGIRDTDMAEEIMKFTKDQILSQASQAMLAQANSLPQSVLSLIGG